MRGKGRHDPCVLPRAVPIVESMVALVLVDALMQHCGQNQLFDSNANLGWTDDITYSKNLLGKKLSGFGSGM